MLIQTRRKKAHRARSISVRMPSTRQFSRNCHQLTNSGEKQDRNWELPPIAPPNWREPSNPPSSAIIATTTITPSAKLTCPFSRPRRSHAVLERTLFSKKRENRRGTCQSRRTRDDRAPAVKKN
jgi:hypothetical protein